MISIIVPIYNVEIYLCQCIDSILCQTYQDIEVLLIDDGSPDKCGFICEEYAKKDNRIRVFHTNNKGLSAARNLGLQEAKGEYIGFVDSDDWIEPDMFYTLFQKIKDTETNISVCGVLEEYQNNRVNYNILDGVFYGTDVIRLLLCNLCNVAWNKLYKKSLWAGIQFPENHAYEDIATIYRVFLRAHSVSSVSEPLYHYRIRCSSIVRTPTMENLKDYWSAVYNRYNYLCMMPEFKRNQAIIDFLENEVAFSAARIWRLIYLIPKKKRDYAFLNKVSVFVRKHFPLFGKSNWDLSLRIAFFHKICR